MTIGLHCRSAQGLAGLALMVLSATGVAPATAETSRLPVGLGLVVRVIDRPEMRSYQPYSGLQFNFRPQPPVQRGVRTKRPKIVMPKRVAPLIEYGPAAPYSAQGYAYCAEPPGNFEPRTGPYDSRPIESGRCP